MADILNELLAIEKGCAQAFNQKDISNFLSYFDEKIMGFSSTKHDRFKGKAELQKTLEYYLSEAEQVTFDVMEPEAFEFNDTAILNFYWRVTLKTGSTRKEIPGRGSHVFRKIDGTWKIVHEHFSRAH